MNISKEMILIAIISLAVTVALGAQTLDAERDFGYTTVLGTPGDVTGDGRVNTNDGLLCAQYYVGMVKDLPYHRFSSRWAEVHVPFAEMTQELFTTMVYMDKEAALESVKAFEIDFHSKNDSESGTVWIDDVAIYRDNATGYREYLTIGNYDELTVGGSWAGGRYFVYNDAGGTTPPATIEGAVEAGGPSGAGNCLKVIYNLGGKKDDGTGTDITSLGVGMDIIYGNPYTPVEVPMGSLLVADVRTFDGIRFWIKIQKGVGTSLGFGDEPDARNDAVYGSDCRGAYVMRARLKSGDHPVGTAEWAAAKYNFFGINIDM